MALHNLSFRNGTPFDGDTAYVCVEDLLSPPAESISINGKPYLSTRHLLGLPGGIEFQDGIGYLDIDTFSEFQQLPTPSGWYWCEFYGGAKEYRCFLIPGSLRRAEFFQMEKYNKLLDESVRPIYQRNGLYVRQDPTHAMPGFYIVSPDKGFVSTDMLELGHYMQMRFIDHEIGRSMYEVLGISSVLRVNEERRVSYQNVHTWLLPLTWLERGKSIHDVNTLAYMLNFSSWRNHKNRIIESNRIVRAHVERTGLAMKADKFKHCMEKFSRARARVAEVSSLRNSNVLSKGDPSVLYRHNGITVRLDSEAIIPGAYCIVPETHASNCERDALILYLRMRFLDYVVRAGLRQRAKIEHVYKLQEDHGRGAHSSTIRILPIVDIERYDRIYHFTISDYIREHSSQERNSVAVAKVHEALRSYLDDVALEAQDDLLVTHLFEWGGGESPTELAQ